MRHITVDAFKELLEAEKENPAVDFVSVCMPVEHRERHIAGVRNVPFDELEKRKDEFLGKNTIYIHCRSGNRSKQAIEKLQSLGVTAELVNVEGGIVAWGDAGYATRSLTERMSVTRQVFLAAGTLLILGSLGAYSIGPGFLLLTGFVGAGLAFSGLSGWCGMSYFLAKMPWNR
jgi:rhodanese-related sulfurtransferase